MKISALFLVTCIGLTIGCTTTLSTTQDNAPAPRYYAVPYEDVFFKAMEAAIGLNWKIQSWDLENGSMRGISLFGGGGKTRNLFILLSDEGNKVKVDASLTANYDTRRFYAREINKFFQQLDTLLEGQI